MQGGEKMCYITFKCHNCGANATLYDGMEARCPHCGEKMPKKAADKLENLVNCAREIDKDLRTEDGATLFTVEVRNYHVPAHKNRWLNS